MISSIRKKFADVFGTGDEPLIVRSPGRVNLIGEHTDYNEGFVLHAAIDTATYIAITKCSNDRLSLYTNTFQEKFETPVEHISQTDQRWPNYILGVADQLQRKGINLTGMNILVDGNIPLGAGLSS